MYQVKMDDSTERRKMTYEAMASPQPGDRFTEIYNFWVDVIKVSQTHVMVLEDNGDTRGFKIYTKDQFFKKFEYSSESLRGEFWIDLFSRDNDMSWFADLCNSVNKYMDIRNQIILNSKKCEWDEVQGLLDEVQEILENMNNEEEEIIQLIIEWEDISDEDRSIS